MDQLSSEQRADVLAQVETMKMKITDVIFEQKPSPAAIAAVFGMLIGATSALTGGRVTMAQMVIVTARAAEKAFESVQADRGAGE